MPVLSRAVQRSKTSDMCCRLAATCKTHRVHLYRPTWGIAAGCSTRLHPLRVLILDCRECSTSNGIDAGHAVVRAGQDEPATSDSHVRPFKDVPDSFSGGHGTRRRLKDQESPRLWCSLGRCAESGVVKHVVLLDELTCRLSPGA